MRHKKLGSIFILIIMFRFWLASTNALALTPKVIYQQVSPGVVFIFASEAQGKGNGGTGSIITDDGLVITNAHLFTRKDSSKLISSIWVFLKPDKLTGSHRADLVRRYRGKIVAYDLGLDLALVKILDIDTPITQVKFGDSDKVAIGEQAYAIGHPEQGGLWSLTTGVVSALKSNYGGVPGKDLFQTEASINRGNSGGPLLDEQGVMIGVNSMIARKAEDGLAITDVNFSIKSNVALKWLDGEGYRFAAVEALPSEGRRKPVREELTTPKEPVRPVKEMEKPKEPAPPASAVEKPKQPAGPVTKVPSPEPKAKGRKQGKILTEKNPFNMDELIAGMQEMEDLMEEMRGKIKEFRKRRR